MIKKIIFVLYVLVLVSMGGATFIEQSHGTDYAHQTIYGSWWFIVLWAVLAALGIFYIVKRKVRKASSLALHLSFVVILAGALLTHITAKRGMVHMRLNAPTRDLMVFNAEKGMKKEQLPFSLTLKKFDTKYYDGTTAESDYQSQFTLVDGAKSVNAQVSMNNIFSYQSYRFYQSSYDTDGKGSVLSVNADPWGIPVTYTGYALLFLSLLWMLVDPKGAYRKVLQNPILKKGILVLVLTLGCGQLATAQSVLPKETANRFGRLNILYNDRICPVETYALDFCKKIYGSRSYNGLTAEQVLTGWIFYPSEWESEPFIKVKSGALKEKLNLPDYCSMQTFFSRMEGYRLGPFVQEYYNGNQDKLHKQAADIDGKIQLIMDLRRGVSLKVLPYTFDKTVKDSLGAVIKAGTTVWYSPTDKLPAGVEEQHALYIKNVFSLLYADVIKGNIDRVNVFFDKMHKYQYVSGGSSLPTATQYKAERAYNAFPFATVLFMANLTLGFLMLFYTIYRLTRQRSIKVVDISMPILLALSWLTLTVGLVLRWLISGNLPMANGYETMLVVAWTVMLVSLCLSRIKIITMFGFLLSGFFLLVSHINQMDPAIGQMMPVLNSPLLSVHVSVIMISYALLSLTFLCSVMGLLFSKNAEELQALSRLFHLPAVALLAIGIFIGAIWANVSWGTYWSWDPKETWALITMMVYAVPLHGASLPALRMPRNYHIFMLLAFLTVLMTYFGVNYILGGMHSYA